MSLLTRRLLAVLAIGGVLAEVAVARSLSTEGANPASVTLAPSKTSLPDGTVFDDKTTSVGIPKKLTGPLPVDEDGDLDFAAGELSDEDEDDLIAPTNSTSRKLLARAGGCSDAWTTLHDTNKFRSRHRAPPVTWDDNLARKAQQWSQTLANRGCGLYHSSLPYGENLYSQRGTTSRKCNIANILWYNEVNLYKWTSTPWSSNSGNFNAIGHFTQVVWKATRRMGCGVGLSNGCAVVTCEYYTPGNIVTNSYFKANVLR